MYASPSDDAELPHPPPRPVLRHAADARKGVRSLITRYFFVSTVVVSVLTALMFTVLPPGLAWERRVSAVGLYVMLALASGAAVRVRPANFERTVFAIMSLATLVIATVALLLGWGLGAPGFAFYGIFICLICAAASLRWGVALSVVTALTAVGVELASQSLAPTSVLPGEAMRLVSQFILIGVGLAGGVLVSIVVGRYLRSADDREQRFRGLLAIAADAYWEIDQDYRLVTATSQRDESQSLTPSGGLGQLPWQLRQFGCDSETLDSLLADLDARVPFRDRLVHWQDRSGGVKSFLTSGEPRFDARGIFKGYWGVARDISDEIAARQALAATETRYQELFARIPTPLVLHREGHVIDANPAGLALFGHDELTTLLGRDLLPAYESGDSRERERRRIDELAEQPPGTALPVADFRLLPRNGRRVSVRSTGVRVEADGGPATLSIYIDDTERRSAEEAVRRSEAMLSHLVATSPDVITLTEMATGRYAMVNDTFMRVLGYGPGEVVGKTSAELAIWHRDDERERFIRQVRERGNVIDMPAQFNAKDGRVVEMLISGARFAMDRRDYLVVNARDITEAERSRLEREAILENASIGIAVTRDGRIVLANPRFEQMYGWPPGGLLGMPGSVVWPSERDHAELGTQFGPALSRGEAVEFERPARHRSGSQFLARMLARAIDPRKAAQGGTIWIVEDVTKQREDEQKLADARDAAEAASRAKSAFLANTSHELRTPLNGVLNLAQLARDPSLGEARRHEYLNLIADSAQSLAGTFSDILDRAALEVGRLELETKPFDLAELLQSVHRSYATLAALRQLAFELEPLAPGVAGVVVGDPLRVRQILGHFVGNALKFTDAGYVNVAARRNGDRVRLEVRDTGPGISPAMQARLFRAFTQADESTTRRYGGTGLGLSICRELAQLMGGEVGVISEEGRPGCVLWAELPLPFVAEPAERAPPPTRDNWDLAGARVLVVDDEDVNKVVAEAWLKLWGVRVEQASDGSEAIAAVQRAAAGGQAFDAVLMDVMMPVMSGHAATQALRGTDAGRKLPIIAWTAAANERPAALAAGMDDFVNKPIVDPRELQSALARSLAKAR